jgi:hypothetical protein
MITDEEAEARTLPKRKTIVAVEKEASLNDTYGVKAALAQGNAVAVEKYRSIMANKQAANDFLTRERLHREKDQKIQERLKATNRLPPETQEEIERDPDLGMDTRMPSPKLKLPTEVDLLYVEKPIDRYEPN